MERAEERRIARLYGQPDPVQPFVRQPSVFIDPVEFDYGGPDEETEDMDLEPPFEVLTFCGPQRAAIFALFVN